MLGHDRTKRIRLTSLWPLKSSGRTCSVSLKNISFRPIFGWFIDETPLDSEEFSAGASGLQAAGDSAALGRMDLLTVVLHELAHILGHDHGPQADIDSLMNAELATGLRRLPTPGELAALLASD